MHPAFQQLLVLQDRDLQLDRLQEDLEEIPRLKQQELKKLSKEEQEVKLHQGKLQENRKHCHRLELDIQTRKNSIQRLEAQRYETKKNDKYAAIGKEIENYQAQITELEDQELQFWEEAEQIEEQLNQAKARLEAHQKHIDEDIAKLDQRVAETEKRKREVEAERHVIANEIEESLLNRYNSLRRSKPNPCAEVRNGNCQGCYTKVPRGIDIEAGRPDRLVECPTCGRFLYAVE